MTYTAPSTEGAKLGCAIYRGIRTCDVDILPLLVLGLVLQGIGEKPAVLGQENNVL